MKHAWLAVLLAAGVSAFARVQSGPNDVRARAIYKELVEINTTDTSEACRTTWTPLPRMARNAPEIRNRYRIHICTTGSHDSTHANQLSLGDRGSFRRREPVGSDENRV